MRRREFITLLGGAAGAWPLAARAQQPGRMKRVGVLMGFAEADAEGQTWLAAFERSLAAMGWTAGLSVRFERRYGGGVLARTQALAKELVETQPDVILAGNTPAVRALMRETRSVPVVFANLSDPVDTGVVTSLARPGGNVTGFTAFEYSMAGKWLQVLKSIAPRISRTALVYDPDTAPFAQNYISSLQAAGAVLGVAPTDWPVREVADIESIVAAQGRESGGSIVVMPTNFTNVHRATIMALAARHRVPAIYPHPHLATEGGLIAYGTDTIDLYQRAAGYVDRILRGANPSELPVQQPTRFKMIINLKTAKALGLDIPPGVLAIVDEVIE